MWIVLKNTGEIKVMSMSSCTKDRRRLSIVKCDHEAVGSFFTVGLVARDRKREETKRVHTCHGSAVRPGVHIINLQLACFTIPFDTASSFWSPLSRSECQDARVTMQYTHDRKSTGMYTYTNPSSLRPRVPDSSQRPPTFMAGLRSSWLYVWLLFGQQSVVHTRTDSSLTF